MGNVAKIISWIAVNGTVISSIAAACSAIFSFIGLFVSIHFSRKSYYGNIRLTRKLELLRDTQKLISKYIAAVKYTAYLYDKASSNRNDSRDILENSFLVGSVNFDDYDKQMNNARIIYQELQFNLKVQSQERLLNEVNELWKMINTKKLKDTFGSSRNLTLSEKEKEFNHEFTKLSNKIIDDFSRIYQQEFNKLTK